ncbi:hypothetical protein ColTof4_01222 [Colletotrichum tofieldiae]|nr:hypothetical protein ColTof3_08456 [Colletotrichum tofieldiae]GKT68799.1 hypothetical protein ColTof4_01222 [Colletotrichum tofieldiae]
MRADQYLQQYFKGHQSPLSGAQLYGLGVRSDDGPSPSPCVGSGWTVLSDVVRALRHISGSLDRVICVGGLDTGAEEAVSMVELNASA